MDALFVVVAELLIVPLVLWGLIALELTVGVVASIVSVFLGRRKFTDAVRFRWRTVRKRLVWSLIFMAISLLLADLVFFDTLVRLALASADEREDLAVSFVDAEGSFILGRVELHDLSLAGQRGGDDPSARFAVGIDTLVIDIDTARLLAADFAVEEIAVDGVDGSVDRLRAAPPKREREREGFELSREFSVARLHVGELDLALRDHTGERERALTVVLDELDVGQLDSETALFDLLYRVRGRGSVDGHAFVLTATEHGGQAQTTLELPDLPLDALGEQLDAAAGVRAHGSASLTITNRYDDSPPEPKIVLGVEMQLRELELEAGDNATMGTRFMLEMAERALERLGDDFPLELELSVLRSELEGVRSLAESDITERVAKAIVAALQQRLSDPS